MLAAAAIYPVEVARGPRPKWARDRFLTTVLLPKLHEQEENKWQIALKSLKKPS